MLLKKAYQYAGKMLYLAKTCNRQKKLATCVLTNNNANMVSEVAFINPTMFEIIQKNFVTVYYTNDINFNMYCEGFAKI